MSDLAQIIRRAGSQPSQSGPAAWFTGRVRIDPLFPAVAPSRAARARVTIEPGARPHRHPQPPGPKH